MKDFWDAVHSSENSEIYETDWGDMHHDEHMCNVWIPRAEDGSLHLCFVYSNRCYWLFLASPLPSVCWEDQALSKLWIHSESSLLLSSYIPRHRRGDVLVLILLEPK